LTYNLGLRNWPSLCQDESTDTKVCVKNRLVSKVIVPTQRHTDIPNRLLYLDH